MRVRWSLPIPRQKWKDLMLACFVFNLPLTRKICRKNGLNQLAQFHHSKSSLPTRILNGLSWFFDKLLFFVEDGKCSAILSPILSLSKRKDDSAKGSSLIHQSYNIGFGVFQWCYTFRTWSVILVIPHNTNIVFRKIICWGSMKKLGNRRSCVPHPLLLTG